jgi:cytochrome c oxidase subunit 2
MKHRLLIFSLSLVTPWLTGCGVAQSVFQKAGPASARITYLSLFMTVLFLTITLIMWALIGWGFKRRRGSLAEHAPIDAGGGHMWIAIGGVAVPLLVLSVLFVLGLNLLMDFPIHGMHGNMANAQMTMKPEIRITGHQWWWEIVYLNDDVHKQFTTANELHLPSHRPVNIEVVTADVMHSFWIPALHGKVDLIPGHKNYIRIEASGDGTYVGQCAEYCGAQHAHMRLIAVTEEPGDYEAWLEAQRLPGADPQTPEAVFGQRTFLAGPCSMCHTVRGTIAGGRVAPDLTHIGSRLAIAADTYPNNNAYLEAWITHAQSMKPGVQMPDLTQFTGDQLNGLVAYLRQLQ